VKDNNFIFGAYTHCAWPAVRGTVADPTGKSFLFSLVNKADKAVRFSLRDKDCAIELGDCICFGADKYEHGDLAGFPNFIIMHMNNGAADKVDASAAFSVNSKKAYQPDDAAQLCDNNFLAGRQRFTLSEIQVYQL